MKKQSTRRATKTSSKEDIIQLILADHKPLKKLIKIMKDVDNKSLNERRTAFSEFAPLLMAHANPEEFALYAELKTNSEDMRLEGTEGELEHGLADQLIEETKSTQDATLWSARAKILAEMVEHHIEEEEGEMLPEFKKKSVLEVRIELGKKYLERQKQLQEAPDHRIAPKKQNLSEHFHS